VIIRKANREDGSAMSTILTEILSMWRSERPGDAGYVREYYIDHPDTIKCSVAESGTGEILGFQSLKFATENSPYELPAGWGIIGTYVDLKAARTGVGSQLFAASVKAAEVSGLAMIDATIADTNERALAYYDAMGFATYRTVPGFVSKCYKVFPK